MKKNDKKFFYHDIVSQIHGLRLFIQSKKSNQKTINEEELTLIDNELSNLQNITLDFFKENHKNIVNEKQIMTSDEFHTYINELKKVYLLDSKLWISEIGSPVKDTFYHRAFFIRVLSNLFKNMQESVKSEAYLTVNYLSSGEIRFSFKNDFLKNYASNEYHSNRESLGIKSVFELSEDQGWSYDHKFEEDQFETSLIISPLKMGKAAA